MTFLPPDLYAHVERSVPFACVDFIPIREGAAGREVGLILRESPFGDVWCHLGGRILHGESIAGALQRHAGDTLGVSLRLAVDPQPDWVYQWFPPTATPDDVPVHGTDPRKHAVGLSFLVEMTGDPVPANEALAFEFFPVAELPQPMWPGSEGLLRRLTE